MEYLLLILNLNWRRIRHILLVASSRLPTAAAFFLLSRNQKPDDDIISAIPVISEFTQENNEKGGKR